MKKKIIYQVLARAFKDGKFSSWNAGAFEYLRKLGVSDIWFTGIPRHASGEPFVKGNLGSPYAVCDWYDVNPYLADDPAKRMEEFRDLVRRAHDEGFRVITDFIPNHVACNYSDSHGGIPTTGFCDYDWTDTYKIDYTDPRALKAMTDVALFWESQGVDGLRCDMVEMVDPYVLGQISASLKVKNPEFCLIAEVYDRNNYRRYLSEAGFDLLYDKSGIYDSLKDITLYGKSATLLSANWQSLGEIQPRMLNFLENHDEVRVASEAWMGDACKAFASLGAAALFSNASFMLYSGQECGESAPSSPDGRTSIFDGTRIASIDNPDRKVLSRYRELLTLAASPLCSEGLNWDLGYCNHGREDLPDGFRPDSQFAFLRHWEGRTILVCCNFSDRSGTVKIDIPSEAAAKFATAAGYREIQIEKFNTSYIYL